MVIFLRVKFEGLQGLRDMDNLVEHGVQSGHQKHNAVNGQVKEREN